MVQTWEDAVKLQTYEVGVIKGSSGLLGAIVLAATAYFAALTPAAAAPLAVFG